MKKFFAILIILLFLLPFLVLAANFRGDHKWAWSENSGWLNFQPTDEGVTVAHAGLTGYLWAENVGWVKLDYDGVPGAQNTTSTNWGVTNDGDGNLGGYAWGENVGWINFHPTDSQVVIDSYGCFSGYAWAENIGWIKFDHSQTSYTPQTSWSPSITGPGMASANYRIRPDSINVGGSDVQTSDNYKIAETIGEAGTGELTSSNYKLKAGYRQVSEAAISISLTVPVSGLAMDQSANMSITSNQATNAASGAVWSVETTAPAGYTLSLSTDQTNCLRSASEYFDDYSEATPGTPETWSVDSNKYQFGFSAFGDDVPDGTWGIGSSCTSPGSNNLKYRGFNGINNIQVASSSSSTAGTNTALCLAAEQNGVFAPNGSYTATITATAITQ